MLTDSQRLILRHIARNRSPNSVCMGGAVLNRHHDRISGDIDIEHYAAAQALASFTADRLALEAAGFQIGLKTDLAKSTGFISADIIAANGDVTRLDWTTDSATKFFPAEPDEEFGWRLHPADIAVNKLLAMAGRRVPRDYHDMVTLGREGYSFAALAWAAPGKDPGFTPDLLLDEAVRHSNYQPAEMAVLTLPAPPDLHDMKRDFLSFVGEARDILAKRPPYDEIGSFYMDAGGKIIPPDPDIILGDEVLQRGIVRHGATIGGSWPEISQRDGAGNLSAGLKL